MKKLYFLSFLIFSLKTLHAQSFEWAKVEGHYAYDYGYGISTDNAGNVYVSGKYEENAIFSGTTLPNQGNHDIYVAKYSPSGNLVWIRTGGCQGGDYARSLYCDKTSHVYAAGEIEGGTVIFPGSPITLNSWGDNDIFITAYDLDGNLQWAKREGYYYNEKALGITGDNSGNLFICGYYWDTTNFNGTYIPSKGQQDIFVAKYDASGNFLWMRHAGGPGRDEAKSLVTDASGNVYICGMYSDGAIFGSTTYTTATTSIGKFFDAYIAKYSPDGNLLWVKTIVGDYDDVAWSITKDNAGRIIITGEYSGADFGAGVLWTNGYADIFVACYDANANYKWMAHGGGPLADRARGIGCDGTNIFVTGQFGNTATFGPHTVNAADSSDVLIAAVDNSGNFIWATSVGGAADAFEYEGYESGIAIYAEASKAYVTGALLDGGTFGSIGTTGYTRTDVFVTKMSTIAGIGELQLDAGTVVYPNPGNGLLKINLDPDLKNAELSLSNSLGEIVYKDIPSQNVTDIDLSAYEKGIYFLEIKSREKKLYQKIVLQ